MIIDSHTHLIFKKSDTLNSELKKLLEVMERTSVDKACLVPFPESQRKYFFWKENEIIDTAEALVNAVSKYPDKFFALLWLNPALPNEYSIKMIEKYIVNGPLDGVKLHIQMNARDKRMEPLAEALQAYNIPILFHAWYKTVQKYEYESDPSDIANLASRFPKLRILMAHLSGCGKRGIQDIKEHNNILIDTSGSQPEDGLLEYAIEQLGVDRIVFGSDYAGRDMGTQLGRIFSVDMDEIAREKILSKNAIAFFKKGGGHCD
ncbi:MAG: amidohydrolase family protein [Firmicutes bacterium]|nr:amidohydrolase family protein [Bacillota bacterium]